MAAPKTKKKVYPLNLGDKVTAKTGRPGPPRRGTIIGASLKTMTIRVRHNNGIEADYKVEQLKKVET